MSRTLESAAASRAASPARAPRGGRGPRGETVAALKARCRAIGIPVKSTWSKERIKKALELAEGNVPTWQQFDPDVIKTTADRRRYGIKMIQEFLAQPLAEQKRVLPSLLERFGHLRTLPTASALDCQTAFQLYAQTLTLIPDLPRGGMVGAQRLSDGQHTVLSRLEADIDQIAGLANLKPHVSKHMQTNWLYHLYGGSCSCHANALGVFRAFAHHFLFGVWHWTGNHANCRVGNAMPQGHQQGRLDALLPALSTPALRLAATEALFRAMVRAARQYSDTRPNHNGQPVALIGPVALPFDAAFDNNNIDVGVTWQQLVPGVNV